MWCDVDGVTAEEAHRRWSDAEVPQPSIVVSSGTGIHGYWLLNRDLTSRRQRLQLTALLPGFYRSFGGDHVQNLSRVMRPPGTVNHKDARNGRRPLPCTLSACDPQLRYRLEDFSGWMAQAGTRAIREIPRTRPDPVTSVKNLFDEKYSDPGSGEQVQDQIAQDGRTFWFKIKYGF